MRQSLPLHFRYFMSKKSGSYQADDVICFSDSVELIPYEDKTLALSVDTGNWIVLYNDNQLRYLKRLLSGFTVGDTYEEALQKDELSDLFRVLSSVYARTFGQVDHSPIPTVVNASKYLNVYLTNACNLHCVHCFMNAGSKLENELDVEKWKTVLQDFSQAGGEFVTFTGGEPTMYVGFEEVVTFAHQIGLNVTVLSNGLLWTEEKIHRMKSYIDEIQFSIDGVTEQENAKVRGKNHFQKVVDMVCNFALAGVRTSVATTFTWENLSTADEYKRFVDSIKRRVGDRVFFKLTKKILPGRGKVFSEEENRRYYEQIDAIERYVDPTAGYANFIEGHEPNVMIRNCGFGGLSISSNGNVYFCNRIHEVDCFGNVKHDKLKDILAKGKQMLNDTAVENVSPCKECRLRYVCGGDCRIDYFNFKGHLKAWKNDYVQTRCTDEFKSRLLKKMVDGFTFYYQA